MAIVAVLSMNQALGSSFDRVGSDLMAQVVRRIDQHKDKPIGMGASLVTDKCAQVFEYLKPRWKDYAIVGLFLGFVYQGRQIAQQGRQIAQQGRQIAQQGPQIAQQGQQIAQLQVSLNETDRVAALNADLSNNHRAAITELQGIANTNAPVLTELQNVVNTNAVALNQLNARMQVGMAWLASLFSTIFGHGGQPAQPPQPIPWWRL